MYAIIESCGKQYKVAEGDVVFFEKLDAEEGKKVTFDKVILVSNESDSMSTINVFIKHLLATFSTYKFYKFFHNISIFYN